jgi:regulator-associated protein of mTOR
MACVLNINHNAEDDDSTIDWQLPISFVKKRHTEKIEGANAITQTWRMKERVRLLTCCNINRSVPVERYYLLCCHLLNKITPVLMEGCTL